MNKLLKVAFKFWLKASFLVGIKAINKSNTFFFLSYLTNKKNKRQKQKKVKVKTYDQIPPSDFLCHLTISSHYLGKFIFI